MRLVTTHLNKYLELLEGVYESDRAQQLRILSRMYNRLLGPATSVKLLRPELLDLSIYSVHCDHVPVTSLMRDVALKARPYSSRVPGGGKGVSYLNAILGALGEITERLWAILDFATLFDRLEYGTYEELVRQGRRALGPQELTLFAPEQYAQPNFDYTGFRPDTFLGWIEGRELLSGDFVLVPAQLVLMYYKQHPAERAIGYATTAGLAFHPSRYQGILHGLYEVIERDALNVCWYSRLAPPRVDVDLRHLLETHMSIPLARMSTPYIQEVQIFLMTLDTRIPVFAAVALDRSRDERAFLGGTGASSQRELGLAQALFEVGQSQTAFRLEDPFGRDPIHRDSDLSEVVQFHDAPLYYGHAGNLPRTFWFMANEQAVPWEAVPTFHFTEDAEEYEGVIEWLRLSGLRPIVLDFDSAWPEMSITKVFVPELTQACPPLDPTLGHPRFYELPQRLGKAERRLEFRDLNPDPIPFP